MRDNSKYLEANKQLWNQRVAFHLTSEFYDVPSFKAGKTSLNAIELKALGDVSGKTLLHLQCHFGLDTLSWAREGALVTGADFSETAIIAATKLAKDAKIKAEFICSDVYNLHECLDQKFDIVFTSYGTIGWLPSLDKWAAQINHFLNPGGIFFIADFHPVLWMMDDNFTHIKYSYFNTDVIETLSQGSYGDRNAEIYSKEYGWNHSFEDIFKSLLANKLQIAEFNEYSYSVYNCFNNTVKGEDGMFRIKGLENKLPMMYSIKAMKF